MIVLSGKVTLGMVSRENHQERKPAKVYGILPLQKMQ